MVRAEATAERYSGGGEDEQPSPALITIFLTTGKDSQGLLLHRASGMMFPSAFASGVCNDVIIVRKRPLAIRQ